MTSSQIKILHKNYKLQNINLLALTQYNMYVFINIYIYMCMQRIFVFKYWEIQKINLPNTLLNIMNIINFKCENRV